MNIEVDQDNPVVSSIGQRLRLAREQMGLTQNNVAEQLCLKLSTIKDIEEDKLLTDLAPTFLRGYIRSYAHLVSIPAEDLLPVVIKKTPIQATIDEPIRNLSLLTRGRNKPKLPRILMGLALCTLLFIPVGLWSLYDVGELKSKHIASVEQEREVEESHIE
jgi:cytoskeleton protein RodZ